MNERQSVYANQAVIDEESPWKLTLRDLHWTRHPYKMSAKEWKSLLARANDGDEEAEWEVAGRYEEGCEDKMGNILVRRSPRKAAQSIRRAAEHGSAPAQNTLGVLLSNGDSVRKDTEEALMWLRRAFRAGHSLAASNLAITYREIGQLRMAVKWFRKAANAGDGDALVQLGIHHYWGKGVRKNPNAAIRCFRKAVKGGNICGYGRDDAFFLLGLAHFEGKGVKKSTQTAKKLFQRANVDDDHPAARVMLQRLAHLD